jgi:Raf kinase inhibitor-like YbhB/YbcL family protein
MADPELTSTAFADGAAIPVKYTADGANVSPPLSWSFLPDGTESVALIVHDTDAPSGDFAHWVAWNLDPDPGGLGEDTPAPSEGVNGFGASGYKGPSPPPGDGRHRYFHDLHALDAELDLEPGASRQQLEEALSGHVLAKTQLVGTYERT